MNRFTTRQIVTMVVAVCVAITLAPTAVWAASVSVVKLSDGKHTAKITKTGQLEVGDGSGPLSVDGTVTTRAASLGTPFHASVMVSGASSSPAAVYSSTTAAKLHITSITATLQSGGYTTATLMTLAILSGPASGSCANPVGFTLVTQSNLQVSANQSMAITYPTPYVAGASIPAGQRTCVSFMPSLSSSDTAYLEVTGYVS